MAVFQTRHVKASGPGKTGQVQRTGYNAGRPPDACIGTKPGRVDQVPYSGPNIARVERGA